MRNDAISKTALTETTFDKEGKMTRTTVTVNVIGIPMNKVGEILSICCVISEVLDLGELLSNESI